MRFCGLIVLTLGLGGCGGNAAPPDIAKIIAAVAAAVSAARSAKAENSLGQYVERRGVYLLAKNPSWKTESNFASLNARIGAEIDQVAKFVDERVATLIDGSDAVSPPHLDLVDASQRLSTTGPTDFKRRLSEYKQARRERIREIAWRASAVLLDLWSGGDATLSPSLLLDPLREALDRRLHEVEYLMIHDEGSLGLWTLASATAGWVDLQRTALFEYPWVDLTADFTAALGTAGLSIAGLTTGATPQWRFVDYENRIYWLAAQNRPRPPAAGDWATMADNYSLTLTAAPPASAAIERLVPIEPQSDAAFEDNWQRSWIYCDIMLAALHVHALRFARARRPGAGTSFDMAAAGGVTLRPLIPKTGAPDPRALMADGPNWFDGVGILHDELQVGDHLVYWNSPFVRYILSSAFGLENSLVTRVAPDGRGVMLAGHGMPETDEDSFSEEMAKQITYNFQTLRSVVNLQAGANPALTTIVYKLAHLTFSIVKWAPFGEAFTPAPKASLTVNGAWWIRFKLADIRDKSAITDPVPTLAQALAAVPKSVAYDPAHHTQPPPVPAAEVLDSVYLPLCVPAQRGQWAGYLASPKPGGSVELDDLIPDGTMVPGFFANGPASTIPVLRPKLAMTP